MPSVSYIRSQADNAKTVKELAEVVKQLCKLVEELQEENKRLNRAVRSVSD